MRSLKLLLLALLLALAPAAVRSAGVPAASFDFEQGEVGQAPAGWAVSPDAEIAASYAIRISDERPQAGQRCAVLVSTGPLPRQGAGWALRSLDAAPFRGKRVRFRAQVRVELGSHGQRARLLLASGRAEQGVYEGTSQPVTLSQWASYEAVGEIPKDAKTVEIGIALLGDGKAFLDSATVEVIGEAGVGNEPARALTPGGLDNLTAFARLFGYVRYFHPSDEAAAADWESLALDGVQTAEKSATPEVLARTLEDFFRPVAPTVRVFPTGRLAAATELAPPMGGPPRIVSWEHHGVALSLQPSIYHSARVTNGESAPDPARPFTVDLGGGVSAVVPLALYKDDQGTLPHAGSVAKPAVPTRPEGFLPSGNDRTTRLADVVLAWNVFEHFYPYFDVVAVDWPAELRKALAAAATDTSDRAFLTTLRRLVAALHDGHGNVFHPRLSSSHSLPFLWDWVEDQLVITRVAPGATAGLAPGDVVVSLDGRPARAVLEAREELVSGATPQWRRWVSLNALEAGNEDEQVRLEVRHPDGTAGAVTVRRTLSNTDAQPLAEARPEKIAEVRPGIFYVDLDRITDDDFKAALDHLAAAKGLVFDLRGYPGHVSMIVLAHLIDAPVSSARWNVPVVTRPDHKDMRFEVSDWPVLPQPPRLSGKAAFLIDGRAISYSETYMGIVENYKLAAIVGGPTAGTNGNVNPFQLPGGYRVIWTGMKVLKHDGSRHHGVGIKPTVPVARTLRGVAAGRDELLEKAIEVVSSPPRR